MEGFKSSESLMGRVACVTIRADTKWWHRVGTQSLVHVLVAMAPCTRLYAYLGAQLARTPCNSHICGASSAARRRSSARDHPYSHWIRTYTSPTYIKLPVSKEHIIDTLGPAENYGAVAIQRAACAVHTATCLWSPIVWKALQRIGCTSTLTDSLCVAPLVPCESLDCMVVHGRHHPD